MPNYQGDTTKLITSDYLYNNLKNLYIKIKSENSISEFETNKQYKVDMLCNDINRYIIRNKNLYFKIRRFVDDNYLMTLSSNNNKTPNLQFENIHAKVLYEISLMMNMYILCRLLLIPTIRHIWRLRLTEKYI